MADTRVVAARTYRAMERLTKARQAIVAHLQLEPPAVVRKSSDPNFDRMRELEVSADFFERLAQKLGVEILTEGETPTELEATTGIKPAPEREFALTVSFERVSEEEAKAFSPSEPQYTDDTRQPAPVVPPEAPTQQESARPTRSRHGRQPKAQKPTE